MRIAFFTIILLLGLIFTGQSLFAQQIGYKYDTIRFSRDRFVSIGDYYSNTKITKHNFPSSLYKVSTEFHYLHQRNIKNGDLATRIGFGSGLYDGASWLLGKGISNEKASLNCTVELYCRGMQNQVYNANVIDRDCYIGTERMDPRLEWGTGTSGIIRIGDAFCGQFQMTLNPPRTNELNGLLKKVHAADNNQGKEFPKSNRQFAIWGNFLNEEIAITYNPAENDIYMYNDSVLLGLYHPDKRKFLSRKSKNDNPFLLVNKDLDENERINLLFLSMLSQWLMNVIRIY